MDETRATRAGADVDEHSFRMERISHKDRSLHYDDGTHQLVLYLEASADGAVEWLACDNELAQWAQPPGQATTPAERRVVVERLDRWARAQKTRVGLGPCAGGGGYRAELQREGWIRSRRPSGVSCTFRTSIVRGTGRRASSTGCAAFSEADLSKP